MKVEFLVSIKHPDDLEPMFLTRDQARELYEALHAEFGDFDQARELSQLARESVARELRLAKLEAEIDLGRGYSTRVPVTVSEPGPSLQDDIERMVAEIGAQTGIQEVPHDVVHASGTVDDAEDRGTTEGNP